MSLSKSKILNYCLAGCVVIAALLYVFKGSDWGTWLKTSLVSNVEDFAGCTGMNATDINTCMLDKTGTGFYAGLYKGQQSVAADATPNYNMLFDFAQDAIRPTTQIGTALKSGDLYFEYAHKKILDNYVIFGSHMGVWYQDGNYVGTTDGMTTELYESYSNTQTGYNNPYNMVVPVGYFGTQYCYDGRGDGAGGDYFCARADYDGSASGVNNIAKTRRFFLVCPKPTSGDLAAWKRSVIAAYNTSEPIRTVFRNWWDSNAGWYSINPQYDEQLAAAIKNDSQLNQCELRYISYKIEYKVREGTRPTVTLTPDTTNRKLKVTVNLGDFYYAYLDLAGFQNDCTSQYYAKDSTLSFDCNMPVMFEPHDYVAKIKLSDKTRDDRNLIFQEVKYTAPAVTQGASIMVKKLADADTAYNSSLSLSSAGGAVKVKVDGQNVTAHLTVPAGVSGVACTSQDITASKELECTLPANTSFVKIDREFRIDYNDGTARSTTALVSVASAAVPQVTISSTNTSPLPATNNTVLLDVSLINEDLDSVPVKLTFTPATLAVACDKTDFTLFKKTASQIICNIPANSDSADRDIIFTLTPGEVVSAAKTKIFTQAGAAVGAITEFTANPTVLPTSAGGVVTLSVKAQNLTSTSLTLEPTSTQFPAGWTGCVLPLTVAIVNGAGDATCRLPANNGSAAAIYAFRAGSKVVSVSVPAPGQTAMTLTPDKTELPSTGGTVVLSLAGQNLPAAVSLSVYPYVSCPTTINVSADKGTVSCALPVNTSVQSAVDYVFTAKSGSAEAIATVSVKRSTAGTLTLNGELSDGEYNNEYIGNLTVTGSQSSSPLYYWTISSGILPPGISMNGGVFFGTPSYPKSVTYNFAITVRDNYNPPATITKDYSITINTPELQISPASARVTVSNTQSFSAIGGSGTYEWSLQGNGHLSGVVGATVLYTAPSTIGTDTLIVRSGGKEAKAEITVQEAAINDLHLTISCLSNHPTAPVCTPNGSLTDMRTCRRGDTCTLRVLGGYDNGQSIDVTPQAKFTGYSSIATLNASELTLKEVGTASIWAEVEGVTSNVVTVEVVSVNPVMSGEWHFTPNPVSKGATTKLMIYARDEDLSSDIIKVVLNLSGLDVQPDCRQALSTGTGSNADCLTDWTMTPGEVLGSGRWFYKDIYIPTTNRPGTYQIPVTVQDKYFAVGQGVVTLTIAAPTGVVLGDINKDGVLNIKDALYLINYLSGKIAANDARIDLTAADIDGNGKVNLVDMLRLLRLLR